MPIIIIIIANNYYPEKADANVDANNLSAASADADMNANIKTMRIIRGCGLSADADANTRYISITDGNNKIE